MGEGGWTPTYKLDLLWLVETERILFKGIMRDLHRKNNFARESFDGDCFWRNFSKYSVPA